MVASQRAIELAKEVLTKIACYDPYFPKPNEGMLTAWAEHISLKNPDRDDMLNAVTKFYESSFGDVKPMPASITSIARDLRRDRMSRDPQPPPEKSVDPAPVELPGAPKISMAEWEERHGEKFPELVFGKDLDAPDRNPLKFVCDHCRASEGSPCVIPGTVQPLTKSPYHPARIAAATGRCGGAHHELVHTPGCELA